MTENETGDTTSLEKVSEDLFTFAFDGQDVNMLMDQLPQQSNVERNAVEYELRILKIVSVGWCLSYYIEDIHLKTELTNLYWKGVCEFSRNISTTTGQLIGQNIDYFEILKNRLDGYIASLQSQPKAPEPAVVVGPAFAENCGNKDEVYAVLVGSRMFVSVLARIKKYLIDLQIVEEMAPKRHQPN